MKCFCSVKFAILCTFSIVLFLANNDKVQSQKRKSKDFSEQKNSSKKLDTDSVDLAFVPETSTDLFILKPKAISKQDRFKEVLNQNPSFKKFFSAESSIQKRFGISTKKTIQSTYFICKVPKDTIIPKSKYDWEYRHCSGVIYKTEANCRKILLSRAEEELELFGKAVIKSQPVLEGKKTVLGSRYVCILDDHYFLVGTSLQAIKICVQVCKKRVGKSKLSKQLYPFKDCEIIEATLYKYPYLLQWKEVAFIFREVNRFFRKDLQDVSAKIIGVNLQKTPILKTMLIFEKKIKAFEFSEKSTNQIEQFSKVAQRFSKSKDLSVRGIARLAVKSLQTAKVQVRGKTVSFEAEIPITKGLVQEFSKHYYSIIEQQVVQKRMKEMGLCMQMHHDTFRSLPKAYYVDPKTGNKHSWRIHLLQFTDYGHLYEKYRFEEPWNSPHNKEVTNQVPKFLSHPSEDKDSSFASFHIVMGEGTAFPDPVSINDSHGTRMRDFKDGTSRTIVAIEAKSERHWADPTPMTLEEALRPNRLGGHTDGKTRVLFADGSVQTVSSDLDKAKVHALLTKHGKEDVNPEEIRWKGFDLEKLLEQEKK